MKSGNMTVYCTFSRFFTSNYPNKPYNTCIWSYRAINKVETGSMVVHFCSLYESNWPH